MYLQFPVFFSVKASWLIDGALFEARLRSVLDFLCYIQDLSPSERSIVSSIYFKVGDSLLEFGAKITKKLRQIPRVSPSHVTPLRFQLPLSVNRHQLYLHAPTALLRVIMSLIASLANASPLGHFSLWMLLAFLRLVVLMPLRQFVLLLHAFHMILPQLHLPNGVSFKTLAITALTSVFRCVSSSVIRLPGSTFLWGKPCAVA